MAEYMAVEEVVEGMVVAVVVVVVVVVEMMEGWREGEEVFGIKQWPVEC